jgi:purine nucleosidase/pyrimidine-specific ribonucleoside hydrolase
MTPVLIDTDPGIDDAVAIMFALKAGLDVKGVTAVSGNLQADRTSINALKVLELMGATHIPVARGSQTPLVRPYPKDPFSHGDDGLAGTGLPEPTTPLDPRSAPELIVELAQRHAGELVVLALGPLTNLALAVRKDPDLVRKIEHVYLIGGAYGLNEYAYRRATGDNPVSEWNVYVDPEAAQEVFDSGLTITALGLEVVTHPAMELREHDLERLRRSTRPEARFLLDVTAFVRRRGFASYCGLIDSLTVAAALDPSIITTQRHHVAVETTGTVTLGQTVIDIREHFRWEHLPQLDIADAADHDRMLTMLVDALTSDVDTTLAATTPPR